MTGVIREGAIRTYEMGGSGSTMQMVEAIASRLWKQGSFGACGKWVLGQP
jgi:hypothetical protein